MQSEMKNKNVFKSRNFRLVFMGALVAYIVAAIYIAMFSMYGAM